MRQGRRGRGERRPAPGGVRRRPAQAPRISPPAEEERRPPEPVTTGSAKDSPTTRTPPTPSSRSPRAATATGRVLPELAGRRARQVGQVQERPRRHRRRHARPRAAGGDAAELGGTDLLNRLNATGPKPAEMPADRRLLRPPTRRTKAQRPCLGLHPGRPGRRRGLRLPAQRPPEEAAAVRAGRGRGLRHGRGLWPGRSLPILNAGLPCPELAGELGGGP